MNKTNKGGFSFSSCSTSSSERERDHCLMLPQTHNPDCKTQPMCCSQISDEIPATRSSEVTLSCQTAHECIKCRVFYLKNDCQVSLACGESSFHICPGKLQLLLHLLHVTIVSVHLDSEDPRLYSSVTNKCCTFFPGAMRTRAVRQHLILLFNSRLALHRMCRSCSCRHSGSTTF